MISISPYAGHLASFRRHLRFANKSERTVKIYLEAATKFATWLAEHTDAAD